MAELEVIAKPQGARRWTTVVVDPAGIGTPGPRGPKGDKGDPGVDGEDAVPHDHPYAAEDHAHDLTHDHDGEYSAPHAHPFAADDHTHDFADSGHTHPVYATDEELAVHAAGVHGTQPHAIGDHTGSLAPADVGAAEAVHVHDYADTAHTHVLADPDIPASIARDAEVTAAIATHAGTPHGGGEAFAVGSGFITFVDTNPASLLGYGTWAARGAGRVLIGVDAGQSGGDLLGSATHGHSVTQPDDHTTVINHTHPVTDPGHTHVQQRFPTATGGSTGFTVDTSMSGTPAAANATASSTTGVTTTNPAGGVASQAHTGAAVADSAHLPPAIAVYIWERTA